MTPGKFITFEGLDGAGKSTHISATVSLLQSLGRRIVATREPGGTLISEKIRCLLLAESMDLSTETLLMFAARQSHVSEVIRPALARATGLFATALLTRLMPTKVGGVGYLLIGLNCWRIGCTRGCNQI